VTKRAPGGACAAIARSWCCVAAQIFSETTRGCEFSIPLTSYRPTRAAQRPTMPHHVWARQPMPKHRHDHGRRGHCCNHRRLRMRIACVAGVRDDRRRFARGPVRHRRRRGGATAIWLARHDLSPLARTRTAYRLQTPNPRLSLCFEQQLAAALHHPVEEGRLLDLSGLVHEPYRPL
jgi:hypothetical protein